MRYIFMYYNLQMKKKNVNLPFQNRQYNKKDSSNPGQIFWESASDAVSQA